MAGGHVGTYGAADGVTQPGGTPGSTVRGRPASDPDERDLLGEAGEPRRTRLESDLALGAPVDAAEQAARAQQPGQQIAAGEG